jgi:hypothetical protein
MVKAFADLSERGILALAISLEEDDARIYGDYAERLKADFPDTAKMLKVMQDQELVHVEKRHFTRLQALFRVRTLIVSEVVDVLWVSTGFFVGVIDMAVVL